MKKPSRVLLLLLVLLANTGRAVCALACLTHTLTRPPTQSLLPAAPPLLQGEKEVAAGIPISPPCNVSTVCMPAAQLFFIERFMAPTLEAFRSAAPSFYTLAAAWLADTQVCVWWWWPCIAWAPCAPLHGLTASLPPSASASLEAPTPPTAGQ